LPANVSRCCRLLTPKRSARMRSLCELAKRDDIKGILQWGWLFALLEVAWDSDPRLEPTLGFLLDNIRDHLGRVGLGRLFIAQYHLA
jgi:hypothetical protein